MINYEVNPDILTPYLPAGTEIDLWQGKALVSMVGFMFNNTTVLGIKWPFHINFEEVNLRFYVRYFDGAVWKRGAVFVSEIVPKYAIAAIANLLYREHYRRLPMRHSVKPAAGNHTEFLYEWKLKGKWNKLGATVSNEFKDIQPDSPEEFILEHYWGYNPWDKTTTTEYQVEHVSWRIGTVKDYVFEADVRNLYGEVFVPYLTREPVSVFFAEGSDVNVGVGAKIKIGPKPVK